MLSPHGDVEAGLKSDEDVTSIYLAAESKAASVLNLVLMSKITMTTKFLVV